METIILSWYVLVETGSVALLTLFAALNFTGTLIAPLYGVVGDRIGQRNLLVMMRTAYALLAGMQMTLALTGQSTPLLVLILAAIMGLIRPSDMGMRGALVAAFMPHHQMVGAMSISRTTGDTARIVGALGGAALFAALGMGPAYIAIVAFYLVSVWLMLCVKLPPRPAIAAGDAPLRSPLSSLREGIAYVWNTPLLQAVVWIAFLANLTAYPLTNGLLPYVAKDIYGTDQTGLGYLSASFALGSLTGSIVMSLFGNVRVARVMVGATILWHALLICFAHLNTLPLGMACLFFAGIVQSLCMIAIAVILMRTSNEGFRGRVMGVRMLAIYSLPVGLLVAGDLVPRIGFAATASIYAVIGLIAMLAIAVRWRSELWRAEAPANAR